MTSSNPNDAAANEGNPSDFRPKIAVTGANGLVGMHMVQHFVQAGYPVVAMVRGPKNAEHLIEYCNAMRDKADLVLVQAALNDTAALRNAFTGVDVVIHAAGAVNPYGAREEIFATNVTGTKNAVAAARVARVRQFIFISSLSVITGQFDQFDVDESARLRPCGEAYADSKIEAEKAVMAMASHISVTSLRPGFIYGPRERAWMPRLITNIANGKAMLIDGGERQTNVIYVENLCIAAEGAIFNSLAYNQVYNLTDGQQITKKQLFDTIADGLSLPRVTKSVPRPVAFIACEVVSRIAPMLSPASQKKLSRFSRGAYRLAAVNQGFSIAKAERDLGYTRRIPFSEGMKVTLEFFRTTKVETDNNDAQRNQKLSGSGRR
ncbi:MAG TPA: NAD-dependent epimerase/dehydratase family protein [Planktothrix sp.]|jgi:nucleoside-diphosphate-sugar epimerase